MNEPWIVDLEEAINQILHKYNLDLLGKILYKDGVPVGEIRTESNNKVYIRRIQ